MDLITGVIIFLGVISTVSLLGWETFQNLKTITKTDIHQPRRQEASRPQRQTRGLFNRA